MIELEVGYVVPYVKYDEDEPEFYIARRAAPIKDDSGQYGRGGLGNNGWYGPIYSEHQRFKLLDIPTHNYCKVGILHINRRLFIL